MNFNSYIFVFLFLPLSLAGYFFLQERNRNRMAKIWLIGMSFWFYGYFNYHYLAIIIVSIAFNYIISSSMAFYENRKKCRKALMLIGICANIGLLFYFKYYDFFIENVNAVFKTSFALRKILLPLGISFYTFQQLSYVIDSYRGNVKYTLIDYVLFVTFFPQLVAGPIVLHTELIPQIQDEKRHKINYENLSIGFMQFTLGLSKKVLIADYLGKVVDGGYLDVALLTSAEAVIVMVSYALQIYFDFSGYSDMAIGLGRMFNFELPVNFNSPYKAGSIIEFWKRWHITLTRFLREYIFFPMGGSRTGKIRTYRNIMIVFLVSGLWHGANWTFLLWGALHGAAEVLQRVFQRQWDKVYKPLQWAVNFTFLVVTWTIFRASSVQEAGMMISRLWKGEMFVIYSTQMGYAYILFMLSALFIALFGKNCNEIRFKCSRRFLLMTVSLFVLCVLQFARISPFLYFNF